MIVGTTGTTARRLAAFVLADQGHLDLTDRQFRRVVKRMRQQTGEYEVLVECGRHCDC
jgi:hypothetical protein